MGADSERGGEKGERKREENCRGVKKKKKEKKLGRRQREKRHREQSARKKGK